MAERARCAVVGAANIDIGGFPLGRLSLRDSNPGRITLSAGGVGRNIACNLARLGVETRLIAALGTDAFADIARADCARAGVNTDLCISVDGAASSTYLFIADGAGNMQLAVNDMSVCDRLTPAALEASVDALNGMDAVVLDANLPEETLAFLAARLRVPLIADAVSAAKARRLLPILDRLWAVKPNAIEAEAMTGLPANDPARAEDAARKLVELGARRAFVTLSERGVCCADAHKVCFIPGGAVRMVNATGAGDAFTAALAWAKLRGVEGLSDCARAGLLAASLAVESRETVNPNVTEAALLARLREIESI